MLLLWNRSALEQQQLSHNTLFLTASRSNIRAQTVHREFREMFPRPSSCIQASYHHAQCKHRLGAKHAVHGLWSSRSMCFGVINQASLSDFLMDKSEFARSTLPAEIHKAYCKDWWSLWLFFGFGIGPLVPMKGLLNATWSKDIWASLVLPTLWQQFVEGPFLFQHPCVQTKVHKDMDRQLWCGGTRFACIERWPQSHSTPLGKN